MGWHTLVEVSVVLVVGCRVCGLGGGGGVVVFFFFFQAEDGIRDRFT